MDRIVLRRRFGLFALAATAHLLTGWDEARAADQATAAAAATCSIAGLQGLKLDNARILSAETVSQGVYTPITGKASYTGLPSFCLVKGQATPTPQSLINFELWVPATPDWNGKFVATGNGGYSPALSYADMAYAMKQGYATVGGDTGHQTIRGSDLIFGAGHPEKSGIGAPGPCTPFRKPGRRSSARSTPGPQLVPTITAARRAASKPMPRLSAISRISTA